MSLRQTHERKRLAPDAVIPIEPAVALFVGIAVGIYVGHSAGPTAGLLAGIAVTGVIHRLLTRK